jgi:glycosyltransferase involved in cell wall biosynthesis
MPHAPLVSVVVPVRDGEEFLAASIESVLDQTHSPLQVIVVDDGSRDGSAQIASGYEEVEVISPVSAGLSGARNAGIAASTGTYISFHDADDLMKPEKVERQASFLEEHREYDIVLTRQELLVEAGAPLPFWAREEGAQLLVPADRDHQQIQGPHIMTMLGRRSAFERVGPFAEDMPRAEDIDWLFRAYEAGVGITSIDEELLIRRIHDTNLTQDEEGSRHWLMEAFRRRMARRRAQAGTRDETTSD